MRCVSLNPIAADSNASKGLDYTAPEAALHSKIVVQSGVCQMALLCQVVAADRIVSYWSVFLKSTSVSVLRSHLSFKSCPGKQAGGL